MKRPFNPTSDPDTKMKKPKQYDQDENEEDEDQDKGKTVNSFSNLSEDILFEVLKHADARTLGVAACVNKLWKKTALDERLWELICTRHWAHIGCAIHQLRSVVLALGGFRRLHSQYLWPLSKPSQSARGSAWAAPLQKMMGKPPARWGKDEVHLSLSLLSIRYYEKMNFSNRGR